MGSLPVTLEFAGGSELLFDKRQRVHDITLLSSNGDSDRWTLARLFTWVRDNLLSKNADMLIRDGTVRPGVLVLVNDVDWELLDLQNYVIKPKDKITFLSTLHGG
ncbi:unnamed protein product [Soboliphyme baturini]|uniref:Ubiquitin-related modifier 1 homolog n=1 Tax=Soboliphyme baturini TaxID=241478 RepID=A0A183IDF1_9BILA|nr:unnamed protein product [Soboliphyme baturini]